MRCNRVLLDATTDFGITIWDLARLLGMLWLQQIYLWLDGTRRPCQMYAIRLIKLYQLYNQGLKLIAVHHIDSDGFGDIHLKDIVSSPGGLSPWYQAIQDRFMAQSPQ